MFQKISAMLTAAEAVGIFAHEIRTETPWAARIP